MSQLVFKSLEDYLQSEKELNEDWKSKITKGLVGAAFVGGMMGAPAYSQENQELKPRTEQPTSNKLKDLSFNAFCNYDSPLTYTEWVISNITKRGSQNVFNIDDTKIDGRYDLKLYQGVFKEGKKPIVLLTHKTITPGDYLIKGKQQILKGAGIQVAGGIITYWAAYSMNKLNPKDYPTDTHEWTYKDAQNIRKAEMGVGILIGLVGTGFEIAGIINIGNAGISLNANGIGITIPIRNKR